MGAAIEGRYWAYSSDDTAAVEEGGRIVHHKNGMPDYKRHLGEMPVVPLQDDWEDIRPAARPEPFGYPTQKPVALPERIIASSRNEGDVVPDPFGGSGTTIHAAQDVHRHRVGTDIWVDAYKVMEEWLRVRSDSLWPDLKFIGMPRTRDGAQFMASSDPPRFERRAASPVDGMEANRRRMGDKGIDGRGRIPIKKGQSIDVAAQVKEGSREPSRVQAFDTARDHAGADLGIFTCSEDKVTVGMRNVAANTGQFMSVPVVRIYTVEDYCEALRPAMPVLARNAGWFTKSQETCPDAAGNAVRSLGTRPSPSSPSTAGAANSGTAPGGGVPGRPARESAAAERNAERDAERIGADTGSPLGGAAGAGPAATGAGWACRE